MSSSSSELDSKDQISHGIVTEILGQASGGSNLVPSHGRLRFAGVDQRRSAFISGKKWPLGADLLRFLPSGVPKVF